MFLLFEYCCGTPPSCLKVRGWWWVVVVVVAWSNLVSAQGPLILGLGLKGLGPGLDNRNANDQLNVFNSRHDIYFIWKTMNEYQARPINKR